MTRDFKAIMAWWREMAQRNKKCDLNPVHPTLECFSTGKLSTNTPSEKALIVCDENEVNCLQKKAASRIQLGWRSFILCNSVRRPYSAATKIQTYYRCWMLRKAFVNQKLEVIIIQNMFKCIKCWRDFQQYKIAAGLLSAVCSAIASVIGLSFEATGSCRLKAGETGTLTSLGVFDGLLLFGYHGACCLLCVPTKFCCCATSGMGSTLLSAVWNGAIAGLLRLYLQNSMSFYLLILGSNSCCCWVGSCAAGLLLRSWASCCWSGWTLYSVAECLAATVGCQIFELFMSGARAL